MKQRPACAARLVLLTLAVLSAVPLASAEKNEESGETLDWASTDAILAPVREWAVQQAKEKNTGGSSLKKVSYSRAPQKIDDSTYELAAHVNTAEKNRQVTERYRLTVKNGPDGWALAGKEVVDTHVGLYRTTGAACFPFERLTFDREGLTLSGSHGSLCAAFLEGGIPWFGVHAEDLAHSYAPPPHAQLVPTAHDFYALHELMSVDHKDQLEYDPAAFWFSCDVETCEKLLQESFVGLTLPSAEERSEFGFDVSTMDEWAQATIRRTNDAREQNAFSGFRGLDREGNVRYRVFVPRELEQPDGTWLRFDNWAGWEVSFGVTSQRGDLPNQLRGPVYGYYSEDTVARTDAYELERRDSSQSRWFEVHSLRGEIALGTQIAEELDGDVTFGLTLKQDVRELPFYIISFRDRRIGGGSGPKPIVVNSIEVDGEEATWVQTGNVSGRVVLPQPMTAGSKIRLRMHWKSQAILKFTPSYSYLPRQGWMPFVRFGDVIDDFELTLRSPAKYDILGIGHKVDETIEDKIRVSHWKADAPVNFPTVIFGRYESDTPKFTAKKLDDTEIPVTVHVDDASFSNWGIRANSLRPIAEQAANAINLYSAISGLDYPFGELNLVNDPLGFLYGQAPSSVIYLGSGVFRGEGALAPYFLDSTGISKFLKSVVAHEVGHQWWGNRISNANDRNYWFVESLAEYFSALYTEFVYGAKDYEYQVADWRRNILGSGLKGSVQNASTLFAGEWGGGRQTGAYTAAVYNKGPYAFHMLRQTFRGAGPPGPNGADQQFFHFLKQFSLELADLGEVVTLDIQRAAERALGGIDAQGNPFDVDLGWFFDQWIRGSGVPEYALHYGVRETEDGKWLIEGTIRQRVRLGSSDHVMRDLFYRGVVYVTAKGKGGPYRKRVVINGAETPLLLKVPVKPLEVTVNEGGEMLAHDTLYNQSW